MLFRSVFHGKNRSSKKIFDNAHEPPFSMKAPLFILAIGSIFAGYIGSNLLSFVSSKDNFFKDSIFVSANKSDLLEHIHHVPLLIKFLPLIVGCVAILLAYILYIRSYGLADKIAKNIGIFYKISFNKWYFDEIYQFIFVNPVKKIGNFLWRVVDIKLIDGVPNGLALLSKNISCKISKLETGYIYSYSLWMVLGLVLTLLFIISLIKTFPII